MRKLLMGLPDEASIVKAVREMFMETPTEDAKELANIVSDALQSSPEALEVIDAFQCKRGLLQTKGAAFSGGFMAGWLCAMGWAPVDDDPIGGSDEQA